MVRLSNGFTAAIQFLTRVPVRSRTEPPPQQLVVPWFPVVGTLVGAAVGGVAAGLWQVSTPLVAAAVAVIVGVVVTGAFHEDGLADVADAFAGGWAVERRLEILKDPHHGSYGVAALTGSIVVRVAALGSMPGPAAMLWSAIAAHTIGRGAAVALMGAVPAARRDGLGAAYARPLSRSRTVAVVLAAIALSAAALLVRFGWHVSLGRSVVAVVVAAALATIAIGWLARRKIGGITGDVLGAAEQVAECLVLVVLAATRWP